MNTSPYVREWLKLLRFLGIDIFFNPIALYHGVTQSDNSEIQNAVIPKRMTSRTCRALALEEPAGLTRWGLYTVTSTPASCMSCCIQRWMVSLLVFM